MRCSRQPVPAAGGHAACAAAAVQRLDGCHHPERELLMAATERTGAVLLPIAGGVVLHALR
jgi:hypothetical protein